MVWAEFDNIHTKEYKQFLLSVKVAKVSVEGGGHHSHVFCVVIILCLKFNSLINIKISLKWKIS